VGQDLVVQMVETVQLALVQFSQPSQQRAVAEEVHIQLLVLLVVLVAVAVMVVLTLVRLVARQAQAVKAMQVEGDAIAVTHKMSVVAVRVLGQSVEMEVEQLAVQVGQV
jgi:heme/copper-type cytochrome/quinol oxidase subunit 2